MDPLSIVASSITLIGATIATSEAILSFISGIRNLDAELDATSQDVANFRHVLVELEESTRIEELLLRSLPQDVPPTLQEIADRVPATSSEVLARVRQSQNKLADIETSVRRISSVALMRNFRLLERKKLARLRQDLRDIRLNLSAQYSVKTG